MTEIPLNCWGEPDQNAVREQLDRILASAPFSQSQRRKRFLQYLVTETLAGHGDQLKGYTIAVDVFDRRKTFDPLVDPLVRIEAGRLRDKLREYYDSEGQSDPIRIDLPKGGYAPVIAFRQRARPAPAPAPGEPDAAAPADASPPASSQVVINWPLIVSVAALGLVLVLGGPRYARPPTLPERPSIAVLPFDNIGEDHKWERFADGITEDIITDLAHSKDLIVIARNSTEVYKGKPADIRLIGRNLNVKYVLEGSIQFLGERLRVTAQLIDAASGSHVWSERYDRPAEDLFSVQNDVTQRIAATLAGYEGRLRTPNAA